LAKPEAGQQQGEHQSTGSGHVRVNEDQCNGIRLADIRDLELGTAVEAEPAEPEYQCAERSERQVTARYGVDLAVSAVLAFARAEHDHACQGRGGAAQVDRAGAGEVEVTEVLRQEAAAPVPEALDRIDEAGQHDGEHEE
jgi:hypothetical protein